MLRLMKLLPTVALIGLCAFLVSCGKETKQEKAADPITPPVVTDLDAYLNKQEISCESGLACPEYLVKIVVLEGVSKPRICTGFLTDSETVATSSSCLTTLLRQDDQDCSKDVFFFFPKTFRREAIRRSCSRVIQVSQLDNEDPVFTRSDIAFLSLSQPVKRSLLYLNREGVSDNQILTRWSVEETTDPYRAVVRREQCRAIHNSYINPLANKETSPNMIFGDCPFKAGNTGAPIVDNGGKVRAITSLPIRPRIIQVIQENYRKDPLKDMFYASNLSCAPSIYDSEVEDEKECNKELTYRSVGEARGNMTDSSIFYQEAAKKILESVDLQTKFIKFNVKFQTNPNTHFEEAIISPVCFKNYESWKSYDPKKGKVRFSVQIPSRSFQFSTDEYSRIVGVEKDSGSVETEFEFNTRVLRYKQPDGSHKAGLTVSNEDGSSYFEDFTLCKKSLF